MYEMVDILYYHFFLFSLVVKWLHSYTLMVPALCLWYIIVTLLPFGDAMSTNLKFNMLSIHWYEGIDRFTVASRI